MKAKKIGIDVRVLGKASYSGIREYTANIICHILKLDRKNYYKLFLNSFRGQNLDLSCLKNFKNVEIFRFHLPNRFLDLGYLLLREPKIEHFIGEIDLLFSPHFNLISSKAPRILVIHDLSFKFFPYWFDLRRRLWHSLMVPIRQIKESAQIVVPSFSTKEDLIKERIVGESKIEVVYHGLSEEFLELAQRPDLVEKLKVSPEAMEIKNKFNLPDKFWLYFGPIEPRKNISALIKAFSILKRDKSFSDYKLVIAGVRGWMFEEIFRVALESPFKDDIIFLGEVLPKEKKYIYLYAKAFVYPSFFEGFGFPPLEAMALGIPVVVSNRGSLPEVVDKAGILVDPFRFEDLVLAIKEISLDKGLQNFFKKEGRKRVLKFRWENAAKQMVSLFENLS